jgi:hypothetical protein
MDRDMLLPKLQSFSQKKTIDDDIPPLPLFQNRLVDDLPIEINCIKWSPLIGNKKRAVCV